jgi:hypothetical protein
LIAALGSARRFPVLAARGDRFFPGFGFRPEDDEHFTDLLDRPGVKRAADFIDQARPSLTVIAQHPDLDQFMTLEVDVDFFEDRGRETCLADHHDWLQMMGPGFQRAAFGWSKLDHNCILKQLDSATNARKLKI